MTIRFLVILIVLEHGANSALAQAPQRQSLQYETIYQADESKKIVPGSDKFRFKGKYEVWYLLGEPVINCTARWEPNSQLSVFSNDGDSFVVKPSEIEIYNLMLVAQTWDPERDRKQLGEKGGHIAAFCDAGIVAQNGNNGFNVAGSPNWDKFLCNLPKRFTPNTTSPFQYQEQEDDLCKNIGGTWYSATQAKTIIRNNFKFEDVTVKSMEVNVGAATIRYEKELWLRNSFAYRNQKTDAIKNRLMQKSLDSAADSINIINKVASIQNMTNGKTINLELLKEYDQAIIELQYLLNNDDVFFNQWKERDQTTVNEQLKRMENISDQLLEEDVVYTAYKNRLAEKANDLLANNKFNFVDIRSFQDSSTDLWGYKFTSDARWLIEPMFVSAGSFTEEGLASVTLAEETVRTESRQIRKTACGRTWTETENYGLHRRQIAKINYKGTYIEGPEWQEYETGSDNFSPTLCVERR